MQTDASLAAAKYVARMKAQGATSALDGMNTKRSIAHKRALPTTTPSIAHSKRPTVTAAIALTPALSNQRINNATHTAAAAQQASARPAPILQQRKEALAAQAMARVQPGELDADQLAEVEQSNSSQANQAEMKPKPVMHGRLKRNASFWRKFTRSSMVLSWILFGFTLRWVNNQPPPPIHQNNHNSAFENACFVTSSVEELLATEAAASATKPLKCILPLGVVARAGTGKLRLIFDARYVNDHLDFPSFKYEGLPQLSEVLKPDDYMVTLDLSAGYHHLDMHESAYEYLGFEWQGKQYHFKQLPFGLAPACWAFTKLTRELVGKWRAQGFRCTSYIDDILHCSRSAHALTAQRALVLQDLEACGFVVNMEKSDPIPLRCKPYLGALINTAQGTMLIPAEKKARLLQDIGHALQSSRPSIRSMESITGQILAMSFSFGKIGVMMTRNMTMWTNAQLQQHGPLARGKHFPLTDAALRELHFWHAHLDEYDGFKPIWMPSFVHTAVVHTDAAGASEFSFGGWGGWSILNGKIVTAAGRWTRPTDTDSSTLLELQAVHNTLTGLNFEGKLDKHRISLRTDNQAVAAILSKGGSMKPHIHEAALKILWYVFTHNIDLQTVWIRRTENTFADALSKEVHAADWKLNPHVFADLAAQWGPFSTDLFAAQHNAQLPRFYSWHHCPGTAGINAFTKHWGQREWCNPPFGLIGRVIEHAEACHASMCLIIPFWPNARWWHQLVAPNGFFFPFVHGCNILPKQKDLFFGASQGSTMPVSMPTWHTLALFLDFRRDHSMMLCMPVPRL